MSFLGEDDEFGVEEDFQAKPVNIHEMFQENSNGSFELTENSKDFLLNLRGKIKMLLFIGSGSRETIDDLIRFQDKSQNLESNSMKNQFCLPNSSFYNEKSEESLIFICLK